MKKSQITTLEKQNRKFLNIWIVYSILFNFNIYYIDFVNALFNFLLRFLYSICKVLLIIKII